MKGASIHFLGGNLSGQTLELMPDKLYLIGRDPGCDICLAEAKVSRRHAHLTWSPEERKLLIEDLRSMNGVTLNGEPIQNAAELHHQDRVQIGSAILEILIPNLEIEITKTLSKRSSNQLGSNDFASPPTDIIGLHSEENLLEEISEDEIPLEPYSEPVLSPPPRSRSASESESKSEPSRPKPFDEGYETDGIALTGNLKEMPLPDLLQMLATTRKSGKLVFVPQKVMLSSRPSPQSAILWLNQGDLVGAHLYKLHGEEAFFELLKWQQGYFALYYKEPPPKDPHLNQPLEVLLLEGMRRLDEEKSLTVHFNPSDTFDVNPDAPLNLLEPEQIRVFQNIWKQKKISQIWANSHLDPQETDDHIRRLLRGGYIKKLP